MMPAERKKLDRSLYNALMKSAGKKYIQEQIDEIERFEKFQKRAKDANRQAKVNRAMAPYAKPGVR